jgi:hypothetical protein
MVLNLRQRPFPPSKTEDMRARENKKRTPAVLAFARGSLPDLPAHLGTLQTATTASEIPMLRQGKDLICPRTDGSHKFR